MDNQQNLTPKISIIILNYNRLNDTRECLNSCQKIDYPNFNVILVDNNSKNNQADILQNEYTNFVQVIKNFKNYGFAQGNNIGITKALKNPEIEYVVCLNNDTRVEADFLNQLVKTAQQGYDMINATVYQYDQPDKIDNLGMQVTRSILTFNRLNSDSPLFCPTGCAVLYSRKLLEKIKFNNQFFDADYFCYAEDFDLGFRALLQGFKPAVADQAIVYHKGSQTAGQMSDFALYYSYRNIYYTLIKNLPWQLLLRFLIKIKIGHWAIIILNIKRGHGKTIFKAYFHAACDMFKILKKRKIIQKYKKISNAELLTYFTPTIFSKDYLKK
ncbi:MAG: glycosyltransferase family 2 protein [Patescibacteria group bacterium]|nr:glycosyltransferase family 2 protein [Patescibacteria group bacterium]